MTPPPPYPKPRPKMGFWRLSGVIRPQRFHFWWRKSSYFMHSRDKCNQRRAGQNTRSGLYVMNFTHVMHINRMHFLCWIQKFIFQGHLRSYKGQIKVKSLISTRIHAICMYLEFESDEGQIGYRPLPSFFIKSDLLRPLLGQSSYLPRSIVISKPP